MQKHLRNLILFFTLTGALCSLKALSPVPPQSIPKRIHAASHIFVGTITLVDFIPSKDPMLGFGEVIYTVSIDEVMYPKDWKSEYSVRVSAIHGIEHPSPSMVGRSFIFILLERKDGEDTFFVSPTDRDIKVSVDAKSEVEPLIRGIKK